MTDSVTAQPGILADDDSSWLSIDCNPTTGEITITTVPNPLTEPTSKDAISINASAATEGAPLSTAKTSDCQPADFARIYVQGLPEPYRNQGKIPSVHNISYRKFHTAWSRAMCAKTGGFSRLMRESADGQHWKIIQWRLKEDRDRYHFLVLPEAEHFSREDKREKEAYVQYWHRGAQDMRVKEGHLHEQYYAWSWQRPGNDDIWACSMITGSQTRYLAFHGMGGIHPDYQGERFWQKVVQVKCSVHYSIDSLKELSKA